MEEAEHMSGPLLFFPIHLRERIKQSLLRCQGETILQTPGEEEPGSFVAQGDYGIYSNGVARGDEGCDARDEDEECGQAQKR